MSLRTHFAVKPPFDATPAAACGRGARLSENTSRVDCLNCQKQDSFILASDEVAAAMRRAFMAQTPQPFSEPWREGNIVCSECSETLFRHGNRTCYGHYDNFHCANCGHVESRLTETGMSF